MLFLVISTPRPERPSDFAEKRQSFWTWIAKYEASGECGIFIRASAVAPQPCSTSPATRLCTAF